MIEKLLDKIATKSAIRVALILLVALFVAIKFPQGVTVVCSMANVLDVSIEKCKDGDLQ